MRIFLIGFMGSGKSHTGKHLANALDIPFIDLDVWIENKLQQSIKDIFETQGEMAFRQLEQQALKEMVAFEKAVISCGGGTPCFYDNMDWINAHGISIYLEATLEVLVQRLQHQTDQRPLLKNLDKEGLKHFISQKLKVRCSFYEQSQMVVHQNHLLYPAALEILNWLNFKQ